MLIGGLAAPDRRTTALLAGSLAILENNGSWRHCVAKAAPLRQLRIVDDTGRLIRAPEVKFNATEIGLDAFGYNIENTELLAGLNERAQALPTLRRVDARLRSVEHAEDAVILHLDSGATVKAPLLIGADGRHSMCRAAADISWSVHLYPQSALALTFRHSRPHHDCSTEFQTAEGPFTQVPLPGHRSSLVWVLTPRRAAQVAQMDDATLSIEIERGCHSIFGKVELEPGRSMFPLSVASAATFAKNRIALVGEAAHVIPPIGAQGLNLGLRDAEKIAALSSAAYRDGRDLGAEHILTQYDKARRGDVAGRSLAIDLVNRSLLSDFLPVQAARGAGLYLLDRIGPLRRAVMHEGVAPVAAR